ncbi:MAG: hypothetical protein RBR59_00820 [Sulfurimonadaceae bacterium]|jgi:iron complex outermembrane receptor protein|nr:hypothetical protein [Sulfurimonadaceae bacterium]
MSKKVITISLALCATIAANPISIERIVVNEDYESESLYIADDNISKAENQVRFSTKSISTLSTHAKMNPYTVLAYSPSVHFTPVDAAGTNEPSFHDPIRIRGKSQSGPGGVYMINSMPLSSNPGGGKHMLDMENVASIDLLKGYLSVDKNLGFSSLIGKVDMKVLAPQKEAGAIISQSFGRDHFSRTFLRFDTGSFGDFTAFGSFSYLTNNKYKGNGDALRVNGMLGLAYQPNDFFKAELYAIRNSDEHHNYGELTYAETKNLKHNYKKDFGMIQPTSANNVNYYDWNKQDFITTNIFADIAITPTSDDMIKIKPYYKNDKGAYWFSKPNNTMPAKSRVINWRIDHDLYGAVASYEHTFSQELKSKIGYWYHKQLPPGPPSDQSKYKVDTNGNLQFDGYGVLSDNDYHVLQAPFVELSGEISDFVYSAGIQYQNFKLGSITTRKGQTSPYADYDLALATSALDPDASVGSKTFKTWIPSLYLGYKLDEQSAVYIDYSRSYGFDVNLFPTYVNGENRPKFNLAGVKLQQLWDKLELETSDNIDLGYKTMVGAISLHPSVFISFVKNKQANIYDPSLGVNYPSNLGDAFGYGAEFSASGAITESLEFMAGLSYNHFSFSENFQTAVGVISDIKGNQLPDAPKVMAKGALSYYLNKWTFTPSVRYTSSRFGDVINSEKVDAYTLVDLDVSYTATSFLGSQKTIFRGTVTNLTNEKYISTITTPDNALAADSTASSYQTGAPIGLFFSANFNY